MANAKKPSSSSAVKTAVAALRADALACEPGRLIGSEEELIARHAVSRPTLRQAAVLVAQEQLLEVRRGVGGGYIARRPTSRAVTHMASVYLSSHDVGLDQIIESMEPIRVELARLAALNARESDRAELRAFMERDRARQAAGDHVGSVRAEREFGTILGRASGNGVLVLFLDILYDLWARLSSEHRLVQGRGDRMAGYLAKREWIAQAVLQGDPDVAVLAARRCAAAAADWLMEDLAVRSALAS